MLGLSVLEGGDNRAMVAKGGTATAPFGGRGDAYGVDLDNPIEPDGVLDSVAGDSVCART